MHHSCDECILKNGAERIGRPGIWWMPLKALFTSAAILLVGATNCTAKERFALVVGISEYDHLEDLKAASNDARDVSRALVSLGFNVTTSIDSGKFDLVTEINRMALEILPGDEVVFYFAGHGVQIDGLNYLLPSDMPKVGARDEIIVESASISVSHLLQTFQSRGGAPTIMVLDACRENPFPSWVARSSGGRGGLADIASPEGSFVLFSAAPGQLALDSLSESDPNPNSVFARALVPQLTKRGLSIRDLALSTRREVQQSVSTLGHNQRVSWTDSMLGDFSFASLSTVPTSEEKDELQNPDRDRLFERPLADTTLTPRQIGQQSAIISLLRGLESRRESDDTEFIVTFDVLHNGVRLPDWAIGQAIGTATVVLRTSTKQLTVSPNKFSAVLENDGIPSLFEVPFDAIKSFRNPQNGIKLELR